MALMQPRVDADLSITHACMQAGPVVCAQRITDLLAGTSPRQRPGNADHVHTLQLQTWPGPGRTSSLQRLGRSLTAPLPANLEDAGTISTVGTYSSVRRGAVSDRFQGFRAASSQPSNVFGWQAGDQQAEQQPAAAYAASDRTASQSPRPQRVSTTYTSLPASR
jgi:hypothetical protein